MILQIRGTSGSGKSTVMRQIMDQYSSWNSIYQPGRKKPLYYAKRSLIVLGHYESACGGCDTIGSARQVHELVTKLHGAGPGRTILCEGLLLSEDVKWTKQLEDVRCLFLTTPVETCLKRIRERRRRAGNTKPLKEDNTRNRVRTIERARTKLMDAGVPCRRVSNSQAVRLVTRWLDSA